jgi:uncharacterized protein (DUF362 family)
LGLDAGRFGAADWNPLSALVRPGGHVVLKPNWIRHFNPSEGAGGSMASVITHGSVVRAVADYAFLAVGEAGRVTIAEAPQQDCELDRVAAWVGLQEIVADFAARGLDLEVIDLRRETVRFEDRIVVDRQPLPGDPAGYRVVDLGSESFFAASELDPERFRGADYDPDPTIQHHRDGQHAYFLSETVLSADLIVNLPKLKTHKKTGVTLALKNLVGVNGDKNWLPHHSMGSVAEGGDEFPGDRWLDRVRSRAAEWARPWLSRGSALPLFKLVRRVEMNARGEDFPRSGNWWGNRTTWRMVCDLNRCVYYSDRKGLHLDAPEPVRPVLTIIDGIVAGEGGGPLQPRDVALGAVVASTDPVAADLAAIRLMGFDEHRIPKVWEPMRAPGPRITAVRAPEDVGVHSEPGGPRLPLDALEPARPFEPHPGWTGHIERSRR